MARSYKKMYELKIDEQNSLLHLQGQYHMFAVAATQDKKNKYPKEPLIITEKQAAKRRAIDETLGAKAKFAELAAAFNKRNKNKNNAIETDINVL